MVDDPAAVADEDEETLVGEEVLGFDVAGSAGGSNRLGAAAAPSEHKVRAATCSELLRRCAPAWSAELTCPCPPSCLMSASVSPWSGNADFGGAGSVPVARHRPIV